MDFNINDRVRLLGINNSPEYIIIGKQIEYDEIWYTLQSTTDNSIEDCVSPFYLELVKRRTNYEYDI